MRSMPDDSRRGSTWLGIAGVWLFGAGLLVIGLNAEMHRWAPPPVPPPSAAAPGDHGAVGPAEQRTIPAPMSRSVPVAVAIPAIGVRARIIPLGLRPGDLVYVRRSDRRTAVFRVQSGSM